MSSSSLRKRFSERAVRLKIPRSDLPAAQAASDRLVLTDHAGDVGHVVALPQRRLLATATEGENGLRIFALDGDGDPLHICDNTFGFNSRALAALNGDLIAAGADDGVVSTWCASTGERLDSIEVGVEGAYVTAMAATGDGGFVAETSSDTLVFLAHACGRELRVVGRGDSLYNGSVFHIAVRGDVMVTSSGDTAAAVWSVDTQEKVAVLTGHKTFVSCAAVSKRFIATGSLDQTVRMYENREGYALVRVLEGLHSRLVSQVAFVGDDLLMSGSSDKTVVFTSLTAGRPVARLDVGIKMHSVAVTPDGRLACVGMNGACSVVSPPDGVVGDVKKHAARVFRLLRAPPSIDSEPRRLCGAEGLPGSRSASLSASGFSERNESGLGQAGATDSADGPHSSSLSAGHAKARPGVCMASAVARQEVGANEISYDMGALKAAASNSESLEAMGCEELSRTVAAAMMNFEEDALSRLPILAGCLRTVFGNLSIGGDSIVAFPQAELLEMIVGGLMKDPMYLGLSDAATRSFEWRLQRFLQRLRWFVFCSACGGRS